MDDKTLEIDMELPSGNVAHAKISTRNGRVAAEAHFDNTPSEDDLLCLNGAVKAICRDMFGVSLSLAQINACKGPEDGQIVVDGFLDEVRNPELERQKRMLRGLSNS